MSKASARPSLADRLAAVAAPPAEKPAPVKIQVPKAASQPAPAPTVTPARVGKTMIAGYFTPEMAKAVKLLAVERDTTVQALIGEGLDAVLHKYGKHPMGER
ncbi:ribbon-helix-helix domain-containing protein [Asticcacaulis sp. EMRT-3]|uniref:ribbon-helix-helix domain-containing protein n=1 Tax=Asticcacaulis sp. EMRT-3 TaxID=3040349 RepID=UPI0024AF5AE7|nr:ribbon-helix-helix domain-containing protein [Asticcacaulis sp. EMRT-3]MDI7776332.1 hypothetical protein [Asticcacaulis sp. EMRT-3]